ncbi:2-dehydropantoate 2-reductase N-terminal domain-containing protein [Sorangium sp. So ce726]|uniref:ketopantoate reductase family protein n=1 Tax=Sorangium sp. So ce726 TaxID=3133319 RepID=UPI003F64892D
MKILMFGRGVIATFYGWALEKAGHTVDFYVRPGRAAKYGPAVPLKFLDLRTKLTGVLVEETWQVRLREDLPVDHDYDLILLSVQHYHFAEAVAFLGPRVGKATVLVFTNLWTDPQAATAGLPASQVAWGFPMAGGGFDEKGVLRGSLFPRVQFGTFGTDPSARELTARDLFRKAGFGINEQRDFRGWLWIHFAQNAGLHAHALRVGSLHGVTGSISQLRQAVLNVHELLPLLIARGVNAEAHASAVLFRAPPLLVALVLKLILKLSAPARLVLESHTNPEELRLVCRDVLDEARRLGLSVPRLEAAAPYFSA